MMDSGLFRPMLAEFLGGAELALVVFSLYGAGFFEICHPLEFIEDMQDSIQNLSGSGYTS